MGFNDMIEMLIVCCLYGVEFYCLFFVAPGLQMGTDWQLAD